MRTFVVSAVCVLAAVSVVSGCTDGDSFDYLALVQQWPPSNGGSNDTLWTLHGVWPSTGSDGPCECNDQKFSENAVESILPELNEFWPSYQGSNSDFWSHEFEKHGTCAEQLEVFDTQLKFFSGAVSLVQKYNLYPMLAQAGVKPSNDMSYEAGTIGTAIYKSFGQYGVFECDGENLSSVSLCLDKNLAPMHCPSSQTERGCGSSIRIPQYPS